MKNLTKLFAFAIVILGFSATSFGQVSADATATGTIVAPIAIVNAGNMNFGNVAVSAVAGTVILAPNGGRTITGGVTLPAAAGTVSAAHFTVSGTGNYTYAINAIAPITVTGAGPAMAVDAFITTPTPTGTLSAAGSQTIDVGATLHVGASQAAGVYTSPTPFTVTVNYN